MTADITEGNLQSVLGLQSVRETGGTIEEGIGIVMRGELQGDFVPLEYFKHQEVIFSYFILFQ